MLPISRRVLVVATVLASVLLASCGGESSGDEEAAKPSTPTTSAPPEPALTLTDLGVDDWPLGDEVEFASPPKAPSGIAQEKFDQFEYTLKEWMRAGFLDEEVRTADDPRQALRRALGVTWGMKLHTQMGQNPVPHVSAANVFADDVELLGPPAIGTAWKVGDVNGGKTLELQARAFYPVSVGGGPATVVGVVRSHRLTTPLPGFYGDDQTGYTWQVFGTDRCALATQDVLLPEEPTAETTKDLRKVAAGGPGKYTKLDLEKSETIDEKTVSRCKAEAAKA